MPRAHPARESTVQARSKPVIQSAARTVRVIALLLRAPAGFHLAQISRTMGLPKVTVLRLLQTLVTEGIVVKAPDTRRYRLNSLFWLAVTMAVPEARLVQDDIHRVLESLMRRTSAAALLAIPYVGTRSMTTGAAAYEEDAPLAAQILHPAAPMHAVASGKCYLASLSDQVLEHWLTGDLPPLTAKTLTSPEALRREIEEARRRGYATHHEEFTPGVWAVAVPVTDDSGLFVAALQLSAPLAVRSNETLRLWVALLQSAAQRASRLLASLGRRAEGAPPRRTPPKPAKPR